MPIDICVQQPVLRTDLNASAHVPIAVLVALPAAPTSAGTPGEVAFDAAGNWYWCYAMNSWARIGPTGYGSAAASPPSW